MDRRFYVPIVAAVVLLICALAPSAFAAGCPAEYTAEQCEQADQTDGGGGGGGSTCKYYLCTNSEPDVRSAWVWCESLQAYTDCPTVSCYYRPCSGRNCSISSMSCSSCPEQPGSNTSISGCPST